MKTSKSAFYWGKNKVLLRTYLCLQLVVEVGIVEFYEAEEQGAFLGDGVISGYFLFHILLQEGHVAKEAARESA